MGEGACNFKMQFNTLKEEKKTKYGKQNVMLKIKMII